MTEYINRSGRLDAGDTEYYHEGWYYLNEGHALCGSAYNPHDDEHFPYNTKAEAEQASAEYIATLEW